MTPHEKAIHAINARLGRLQASLREAKSETAQNFLVQSIVVTLGIGEALSDYLKAVGAHAKRRHAEIKRDNETLEAQHNDLLALGQTQLEKLKANPADAALRKEIDRTQQAMEAVQKSVRRAANALQRELAPSLGIIDDVSESARRLAVADDAETLQRVLKTVVRQVREFYATQPTLTAKDILHAEAWEKAILAEIEQAAGFDDAYARAGYQTMLAIELLTLTVLETPPATAEEVTARSNAATATRVKEITARFSAS